LFLGRLISSGPASSRTASEGSKQAVIGRVALSDPLLQFSDPGPGPLFPEGARRKLRPRFHLSLSGGYCRLPWFSPNGRQRGGSEIFTTDVGCNSYSRGLSFVKEYFRPSHEAHPRQPARMEAAAGAKTPEMSKKIGKPTEPPAAQPTAAKFPERARANRPISLPFRVPQVIFCHSADSFVLPVNGYSLPQKLGRLLEGGSILSCRILPPK